MKKLNICSDQHRFHRSIISSEANYIKSNYSGCPIQPKSSYSMYLHRQKLQRTHSLIEAKGFTSGYQNHRKNNIATFDLKSHTTGSVGPKHNKKVAGRELSDYWASTVLQNNSTSSSHVATGHATHAKSKISSSTSEQHARSSKLLS